MTLLLVALGAAVGAPLRFWVGHHLDRHDGFPAGTLAVNVAGSTLLGALTALSLSGSLLALLGAGFCGGLTTYSAFAVRTYERGWSGGLRYALLTLALSLAGCLAGFALGAQA